MCVCVCVCVCVCITRVKLMLYIHWHPWLISVCSILYINGKRFTVTISQMRNVCQLGLRVMSSTFKVYCKYRSMGIHFYSSPRKVSSTYTRLLHFYTSYYVLRNCTLNFSVYLFCKNCAKTLLGIEASQKYPFLSTGGQGKVSLKSKWRK